MVICVVLFLKMGWVLRMSSVLCKWDRFMMIIGLILFLSILNGCIKVLVRVVIVLVIICGFLLIIGYGWMVIKIVMVLYNWI